MNMKKDKAIHYRTATISRGRRALYLIITVGLKCCFSKKQNLKLITKLKLKNRLHLLLPNVHYLLIAISLSANFFAMTCSNERRRLKLISHKSNSVWQRNVPKAKEN